MSKPDGEKKKEKKPAKVHVVYHSNFEANRRRRLAKDKAQKESTRLMLVPRGTTRRLRREAWATIRQKVTDHKAVMRWTEEGFKTEVVRVETWKPTFAEFSKGEHR